MNRWRQALAGLGALAVALVLPAAAAAGTETFSYTGAAQTWTVPYGVTSAQFDLFGAQGRGTGFPFLGGEGGEGIATMAG